MQRDLKKLEETLNQFKSKLVQTDRKINEKREIEDKMENDLRFLRTNITELESVEYPRENEAEILVSYLNFFFILFIFNSKIWCIERGTK